MSRIILYLIYMILMIKILHETFVFRFKSQKILAFLAVLCISILSLLFLPRTMFELVSMIILCINIVLLYRVRIRETILYILIFLFHYLFAKNFVLINYAFMVNNQNEWLNFQIDDESIFIYIYVATILGSFLFHEVFRSDYWQRILKSKLSVCYAIGVFAFINVLLCISLLFINKAFYFITIAYLIVIMALIVLTLRHLLQRLDTRQANYDISVLKMQLSCHQELYDIQSDYVETARKMKHDLTNQLKGLDYLMEIEAYQKVKKQLKDFEGELSQMGELYQKFSNHIMVDALLQDVNRKCKSNEIKFTSLAKIDDSLFTDIELYTIFGTILKIAVEVCQEVEDKDNRFIDITSSQKNQWLSIHIRHGVNNENDLVSKDLFSNKDDDYKRFEQITCLLEEKGAFITLSEEKGSCFNITLLIPILEDASNRKMGVVQC